MKRSREQNHRVRQQQKEARRAERAAEKKTRHKPEGDEDPDIAGIIPGPQPPPVADGQEGDG